MNFVDKDGATKVYIPVHPPLADFTNESHGMFQPLGEPEMVRSYTLFVHPMN